MFGKKLITDAELNETIAKAQACAGAPVKVKLVGKPGKERYDVIVAGKVAVSRVTLAQAKLALDTFVKLDPLRKASPIASFLPKSLFAKKAW